MNADNIDPTARDTLDCARDLTQAFAQPELSAFTGEQPFTPEAGRAALWLAVALGRCRLFGVALGEQDGVLPPRMALAAAEECSRQLRRRAEKAIAFAQAFDEEAVSPTRDEVEKNFDTSLEVGNFLFVCMDLWAALVAIDEAYHACVAIRDDNGAALRRAIAQTVIDSEALNRAMQENTDLFCTVGDTSLLDNWRCLLVEPYRSQVPWWLDGTLEVANKSRKLRAFSQSRQQIVQLPPASRLKPTWRPDFALAASSEESPDKPSDASVKRTNDTIRLLGRLSISDRPYEICVDQGSVFLSPSPGSDVRHFRLDGQDYPLQANERLPNCAVVLGLAEHTILAAIDDLKFDPDSHTCAFLP
jgi:hypothetical protein